jgi:two-component system cell cycle sensor histidine kinase PleC
MRQDPFPADDLLRTAVRRYRTQAMRAGIALISGAPTGATLCGDRFCLERMLGNLIENAIRFTPQGGRVNVAAYAADNGIVLEITDTGIGMSTERLAAVSQPFAFAFGDAALTREHGGAGLGISIARAIAEQSGGRLAIDSRAGMGTTVAVSLPLRPAEESRAA